MVKFKKSVKRLNSKWFETVIDALMHISGLKMQQICCPMKITRYSEIKLTEPIIILPFGAKKSPHKASFLKRKFMT